MRISNSLYVMGVLYCAACGSDATTDAAQPAQQTQSGATPSTSAGSAGAAATRGAAANSDAAAGSAAPKAGAGALTQASPSGAAGAGAGMSKPNGSAAGSSGGAGAAAAGSGGASASAGASAAAAGAAAPPVPTEKFSFFVTSLEGMRALSKNDQGFGGDLRYGEKTGLEGADKICTELAEKSMPGAGGKGWHAFLSAAKSGPNGGPVHAKDRIGTGPWYDRLGRLVAMNLSDLLSDRPKGADQAIVDDLPNENGEPNHSITMEGMDDNHDTVTATNASGMWDGNMTCEDWTSTDTPMPEMSGNQPPPGGGRFNFASSGPGLGHSWPSEQSGTSWVQVHRAPGCSPSVALVQMGGGMGTGIGNAGGYGGIYCFAMKP